MYRGKKREGHSPTDYSAEKRPSPSMYRESQKRLDQLYSTLVLLATANHRKTTV